MKKLLTSFILLSFITIFSQEYQFDTSFVINSKRISPSEMLFKTTVRMNSLDRNYVLFEYSDNTVIVFDDKKNVNCNFEKISKNDGISYQLKKCFDRKENTNNEIEFQKISVYKVADNTYLLETFKNKNSKKSNFLIKLKLRPADKDMLVLHLDMNKSIRDRLLNELKSYLDSSNYFIESAEIDNKNGYYFIDKMENLKDDKLVIK